MAELLAMIGMGSAAAPAAGAAATGAAAGAGLGSELLKSFLTAGAGRAGSGLVGEMFPQNQMPPAPRLGLLSAPAAMGLGVPTYQRLEGSLVIPQGGPKAGGGGGSEDNLEKLTQLLRQRGRI